MPAYVIDKLLKTGLYGTTRAGVVEGIVSSWISERMGNLERLGITAADAEEKKYIPIKVRKEKD